jgi:SAM-dependent methyltransferase
VNYPRLKAVGFHSHHWTQAVRRSGSQLSDDGIDWDAEARRALSDPPIPTDEGTIKWYKDSFPLPEGGLLLDFGCLLGKWIPLWLKLGYTPLGIDQSGFGLRLAKQRNPHVELVRCMGQNLPFRAGCFDIVVSIAVFQHNRNVTKALFLREIRRVLKTDGVLLFTESTQEGVDENWTNDRYFSKAGWIKFTSTHGFDFLTCKEPGPWYAFRRHPIKT